MKTNKIQRCLDIYESLLSGKKKSVKAEAEKFQVNERSILRDLEDIRQHLQQNQIADGTAAELIYNLKDRKYELNKASETVLTKNEIYSVSKILLESRAFTKQRMESIINKLLQYVVDLESRKHMKSMLANEMFHYIQLKHGKDVVDLLGILAEAVRENRFLDIEYYKMQTDETIYRKIKPVALMFSEFYFYLIAFFCDGEKYPVIYRVDRLKKVEVLENRFSVPYKDRFEEGELRKRIQFMQGGKLCKVLFTYSGQYLEAVLDKLPTAQVISQTEEGYKISAEVYGTGIEMWLKSQGEMINI